MTTVYMWANLIVVFILVFFGGELNYTFRIVGGFAGQLFVLILVPTSYFLHLNEDLNFYFIMFCTAFAAIITAYIDSCAISFAAHFPTRIQESLQIGIGYSTLIGSVYRIITKLIFPPNMVIESSLLYFYCGAFTIFLCILSYYYLLTLPISKRCLKFMYVKTPEANGARVSGAVNKRQRNMNSLELNPFIGSPTKLEKLAKRKLEAKKLFQEMKDKGHYGAIPAEEEAYGSISDIERDELEEEEEEEQSQETQQEESPDYKWTVFRQVAFMQLLVFLVFGTTLSLWPPLVTEIPSYSFPELQKSQWWSLILLAGYSVCDVLGRYAVPYRLCLTKENIWLPVVLRVLYFPVLICCAKGFFFTNDFISFFLVSTLGLTNGYLGSLCIVMINECTAPRNRGIAGGFTGFFLIFGTVAGSTMALILEKFLSSQ